VFVPATLGVAVNVTTPVVGFQPVTTQFDTCVLEVLRYTEMLACASVATPAPLSVSVCPASAVPTFSVAALSVDATTAAGAGNAALTLLVIVAQVSWSVPVAETDAGLKLNPTVVPALAVPVPAVTVPLDDVTTYVVPAMIAVSVVAVMLVAVPTTSTGCEKLTVVGNL
jgi:hypothetical protein